MTRTSAPGAGWAERLRRHPALHRDLFLLACLSALIPAFVTNTLPTSAWFPGVESFRWASFDLGATRYVFAGVLVVALALGVMLRQRWLMLAMLPLLALVVMPAQHIGAAPGIDARTAQLSDAPDWSLAAEREAIAQIRQPGERIDRLLARWPPALPDTAWLEDKRLLVEAAHGAVPDVRRRYEATIRMLNAEIERLRLVHNAMNNPALLRHLRQQEQRVRVLTEEMNRQARPAQESAVVALADLRASIGVHQRWIADKRAAYVEAAYQWTGAVLLLGFLWVRGVGNRVIAAFMVLSLAASGSAAAELGSGDGSFTLLAALQPIFIGALSMIVLRLLFRAVQDNRGIWRSFERTQLAAALGWTLLLWAPFALVVAGNLLVGDWLYREASARLYCQHADPEQCVASDKALLRNSDPLRDTLREDLHLAIERQYARFQEQALAAAAGARGGAADAATRVRASLLGSFDTLLKPSIFEYDGAPQRHECDVFRIFGCLRNIPLDMVNAAYQRPRHRMREAFDRRVSEASAAGARAASGGAASLQDALRDQAAAASRETRQQADAVLLWLAVFSAAGTALMLLVAVRALLLILARLLFARNKDAFTTITHLEAHHAADGPAAEVSIPQGDKLKIALPEGRLLMKTGIDVDGDPPNSLWTPPQPWTWTLRRILHGSYWLKEIDADDGPREISLNSTFGKNYFSVSIPEGAEVAFRWDRFAGMSPTLRLRRTLSLKLGALVLGRVMLVSARGPGLLVLHSYSKADTGRSSVSHVRLVGWQFGTPFRVESGKSKKNVYVDHVQIVRGDSGLAIHEAAPDGRGGAGLWRELLGLFRL